MADISTFSASDVFFSSCQSKSGACAIWKVPDFSTLKEKVHASPKFSFEGINGLLVLLPYGYRDEDAGNFGLYFQSSTDFPSDIKYEFIFKNDSGKDINLGEKRRKFSSSGLYGFAGCFNTQDLLDGKLGDFLPNDILTICCKLEKAENVESETESLTGSENSLPESVPNCEGDSFLSKYRRMLDSGKLSDVVLRVGEETFPAHKVILSTHSDVFGAMFESDLKESRENIVDLIDMDSTVAKAMLLYIYTSEVEELCTEKTLELYVAADRYMLTELKEKCRENVLEDMSAVNVLKAFEIAKLHSDTMLLQAAEKFFAGNVTSILKSKEWKEYSAQKPTSSVELLSYAITSNDLFFFSK